MKFEDLTDDLKAIEAFLDHYTGRPLIDVVRGTTAVLSEIAAFDVGNRDIDSKDRVAFLNAISRAVLDYRDVYLAAPEVEKTEAVHD